MAMSVGIWRNAEAIDCTNGGMTSRQRGHVRVFVVGIEGMLHHFVARADADYAAGKMLHRSEREELDVGSTRSVFFELIARARLERRISKEEARERWTEVEEWDQFAYAEHVLPGGSWCSSAYDNVCYGPTHTAKAFMEIVWPGVQRAVREELARREEGTGQS